MNRAHGPDFLLVAEKSRECRLAWGNTFASLLTAHRRKEIVASETYGSHEEAENQPAINDLRVASAL
jgi:hypothetical protein